MPILNDSNCQAPHAYAVLDMREISPELRLIKLRNPWGTDSWSGDWGPHSKKWVEREDLKLSRGVEAVGEGTGDGASGHQRRVLAGRRPCHRRTARHRPDAAAKALSPTSSRRHVARVALQSIDFSISS